MYNSALLARCDAPGLNRALTLHQVAQREFEILYMNRSRSMVLLTLGIVVFAGIYAWWGRITEEEGIWRFNFSPSEAPKVESFTTVSGNSDYNRWRGYGWLDAMGPLEKGRWPNDEQNTWESRANLNLVTRKSPDDLARSFATGAATFALDLEPGEYEVWILSGDSGHFEYTPWQPYSIMVEGREAYRYAVTAEQFQREFETPVLHDDLTEAGVWQRYVEPRFKWSRAQLDVIDGQLNVVVAGAERDRSKIGLAGDYAYTEIGRGPRRRYTGAINVLVVVSLGKDVNRQDGVVARINAWRQQNFSNTWPLLAGDASGQTALVPADNDRGYTVYVPHAMESVFPNSPLPHQPDTISLRATPGEIASLTVAIRPLMDLGETRIEFSSLHGPIGGDEGVIETGAQLDVGLVRYAAGRAPGQGRRCRTPRATRDGCAWRPTPGMIVPVDTWFMGKDVSKQFWLNYRIPDQLAAGHYRGTITITPAKATPSQLEVELEVLPFTLQRPTHLALGMTYFSPVQDAWFDEDRFWQRMAAEFADMRAHGFTTVQFTGVGIHNYDRLDRVFQLYRDTGFEQPLTLLETYGAMDRIRRDGIAWGTEAFFSRYQQSIRQLLAEAGRRHWPPLIVNFGDEFTNSALEEFGVEVARSLKEIPGIVTGVDANGYKEVKLLAPEVDIVAFNNGWAGPEGVNRDKRLLHKGTVKEIKEAGAEPWLVNVGTDRFSNGYWLWKMARLGVRGKIEWIYRSYRGMPYNSLDADLRPQLVFPGPGGNVIPSLDYQRMRMGFDDLAYLHTLEQLLASRRDMAADNAALTGAEGFLHKLDALIGDDMNRYYDDKMQPWPIERYDALRDEAIDHILELRPG